MLDGGRRFVLTAGFGANTGMMAGASAVARSRFGLGASVWSGTWSVLRSERRFVRAVVDGVTYERECVLAMIANVGSLIGGFIATGPDVRPDDGHLDRRLCSAQSARGGFDTVRRCAARDVRPCPNMLFARGREIRVETVPPSPAQADGELPGPRSLRAAVAPLAARLVRPAT